MNILEFYVERAEDFIEWNPLDSAVAIVDIEGKVLNYIRGRSFDLGIKVGQTMSSKGAIGKCLITHQEEKMIVPKELYGTPIKVVAIPIKDSGEMVGVIATCTTLDAQETLTEVVEKLSQASEEFTTNSSEVAKTAKKLLVNIEELNLAIQGVGEEVNKTDNILSFIQNISKKSNLLGLNAAIEASKAGEAGKGFSVVAGEIRKMAENSGSYVGEIQNILRSISDKSVNMKKLIDETLTLGNTQEKATKEIEEAVKEISDSTIDLEKVSKIL